MIDAHLAALAWYAAIALVVGFIVFELGVMWGIRQEQQRREWEARRREREMRRHVGLNQGRFLDD